MDDAGAGWSKPDVTQSTRQHVVLRKKYPAKPAYPPTLAGQNCWKNLAIAPDAKLGMAWGSPGLTHQTTG